MVTVTKQLAGMGEKYGLSEQLIESHFSHFIVDIASFSRTHYFNWKCNTFDFSIRFFFLSFCCISREALFEFKNPETEFLKSFGFWCFASCFFSLNKSPGVERKRLKRIIFSLTDYSTIQYRFFILFNLFFEITNTLACDICAYSW